MIEALVFDFDGVIIDTEIPSYETWQEVYRRARRPFGSRPLAAPDRRRHP